METALKLNSQKQTHSVNKHQSESRLSLRQRILLRGHLIPKSTPDSEPSINLHYHELRDTSKWTRSVDVILSTVGILLLVILLPLVAIANKLSLGESVFITSRVYGRQANPVTLLLFRIKKARPLTLVDEEPNAISSRWGKLLYKTEIYKLPALLQVLQGRLSFFGPMARPVSQSEELHRQFREYYKRYARKPGWLGMDVYNLTASESAQMVQYELRYVQCPTLKNYVRYRRNIC